MADVHCLNCREPWDLHHLQHDLIKDAIMDYGLWPDLREDLLGPMYPDRDDKSRKQAAAAAKRATAKMNSRWYKPLKTGQLAGYPDVMAAFERAGWLFMSGNVGRILKCSCCDEPYVPLQLDTLIHLRGLTTNHADDCYADDMIAMRMVATDPGRKGMPCWYDLQKYEEVESHDSAAPDRGDCGYVGPYAVVLNGCGEALGIPVPVFNPVYFYCSNIVAEDRARDHQAGWRHWYVQNLHVVAMIEYQDDKSLAAWRDSKSPPTEFDTFEDFLHSWEGIHG